MSERGANGPKSDRRRHARQLVCAVAGLEKEDASERSAMLCDMSLSGAQLLTRAQLPVDTTVKLTIYLGPSAEGRVIETWATVVRSEELEPELAYLWRRRIAVHFDQPLTGLEREVAELAAWARRAGLRA